MSKRIRNDSSGSEHGSDGEQAKRIKTTNSQTLFQLRKVKFNSEVRWIKVTGAKTATYNGIITAVKETFNIDGHFDITDDDGAIIAEELFEYFPSTTVLNIKTKNETALSTENTAASSTPATPSRSPTTSLSTVLSESSERFNDLNLRADISSTSGGVEILQEYEKDQFLAPKSRRTLVNIVVNAMVKKFGYHPSTEEKIAYAENIIKIFPKLKDPGSAKGYESFYDPSTRSGFIAWRLRTLNRNNREKKQQEVKVSSPKKSRSPIVGPPIEELQDRVDFINAACSKTQKAEIEVALEETLHLRQSNPKEILKMFPKFMNTSYLIDVDFSLLFPGIEIKNFLPNKIFDAARHLQTRKEDANTEPDWNTTTKAFITLLRLLPPTAKGRKKAERDTLLGAIDRLIIFEKVGTPLDSIKAKTTQPSLVAIGSNKQAISSYYINVDNCLLPTETSSANEAFDKLFKTHFVFNTKFDPNLVNFWSFIQVFYYGMPAEGTFTPRMREVRSWLYDN